MHRTRKGPQTEQTRDDRQRRLLGRVYALLLALTQETADSGQAARPLKGAQNVA